MGLLIFYIIFSYLFMFGVYVGNKKGEWVVYLLAPITFPVTLGIAISAVKL